MFVLAAMPIIKIFVPTFVGKKLRRVERTDKKTPGTSVGNDVASILKRRIAMELSSSESDSSGSDESDSDWSD